MSDAHILHRASTINHNVAVALQSSAIVIIYINVGFFDATRMYCDKTIEAIDSAMCVEKLLNASTSSAVNFMTKFDGVPSIGRGVPKYGGVVSTLQRHISETR